MSKKASESENGELGIKKFFKRFDNEEARAMRKARQEATKKAVTAIKEAVKNWWKERKEIYKKEEEDKNITKEGLGQKRLKNKISELDLWG